jgi:hypothetical protein
MRRNKQGERGTLLAHAADGFWLFRAVVFLGGNSLLLQSLITSLCWSLAPLTLIGVCRLEGTLRLARVDGGRGLFEHYGTWSLVLACPIIVIILCSTLARADKSFAQLAKLASDPAASEIRRNRKHLTQALQRSRPEHHVCFYLLVLVGLFSLVVNVQNTCHAAAIYGHDVWDSSMHPLGFVVGKIFLGSLFLYVFPITAYLAAMIWFSLLSLSSIISVENAVDVSPFHPDNCGGFRHLGVTSTSLSQLSLPFIITLVGHYYTYARFYTLLLLAGGLVLSATMALLYLPFIGLHRHLRRVKERLLDRLANILSNQARALIQWDATAQAEPSRVQHLSLLASNAVYTQAKKLRTWPYLVADHLKWLSAIVPPIIAVLIKRMLR